MQRLLRVRASLFLGLLTVSLSCTRENRSRTESAGAPNESFARELVPAAEPSSSAPSPVLPDGLRGVSAKELLAHAQQTLSAPPSGAKSPRGVLINVWASWCGSCKAEMPMLQKIEQRYAARGIRLVVVSVDQLDQAAAALGFVEEMQLPKPALIVTERLGLFKPALSPLWRGTLPATFLFDETGKLRYFWGAQVFEEELTPVLDGFLAGEVIDGAANFSVQISEPR